MPMLVPELDKPMLLVPELNRPLLLLPEFQPLQIISVGCRRTGRYRCCCCRCWQPDVVVAGAGEAQVEVAGVAESEVVAALLPRPMKRRTKNNQDSLRLVVLDG